MTAYIKNNQPETVALPFPLAGVMKGGEQIRTRYSTSRLKWLLECGGADVRVFQIFEAGGQPLESEVSALSPPRDYFAGACDTSGAVTVNITWRLPEGATPRDRIPAGGNSGQFAANTTYQGTLVMVAVASNGVDFAVYSRFLRFRTDADAKIVSGSAVSQTVGTDTETDAASTVTVAFAADYVLAQATGVALKDYAWSATLTIDAMVLGS